MCEVFSSFAKEDRLTLASSDNFYQVTIFLLQKLSQITSYRQLNVRDSF